MPLEPSVFANWSSLFELQHDKTNKITCAPWEDSDQPPRFICVFAMRTCHFVGFVMLRLILLQCLLFLKYRITLTECWGGVEDIRKCKNNSSKRATIAHQSTSMHMKSSTRSGNNFSLLADRLLYCDCFRFSVLTSFFTPISHLKTISPQDECLIAAKRPCHFDNFLLVSEESVTLVLYNFFMLIHEYSNGAWAKNVQIFYFRLLLFLSFVYISLEISLTSNFKWIFFFNISYMYTYIQSWVGVDNLQSISVKHSHFDHLLQVSKASFWTMGLYTFFHVMYTEQGQTTTGY